MVECNFLLYGYNILSLVPTFTSAFPNYVCIMPTVGLPKHLAYTKIELTTTILIMKPNLTKSPATLTSY